ncbi:MAG: hypothetical protein GX053_01980 [Tissierella sp.]|nr:hypothetical protein [Tissierella sp.]
MADIQEYNNQNVSIIDTISIQQVQQTMMKITQFQQVIQETMHQNHDFGVIPGTSKPTLLKPGAEKLLVMLGLRSEFEIADSTRDFKEGFFQYQVRCKLYKGDALITEGLGSCNTKEKKYLTQDPFSIDNTILKMAKKRALVDAALLVGSLSDIFTQDLEDMDLVGDKTGTQSMAFDDDKKISKAQAKRMYAISNGNAELCKSVLERYGYSASDDVKRIDYEKICSDIEAEVNQQYEGTPFED